MDTGGNKFVIEDICFMGGDGHFRKKNKPDKYVDLFHDALNFSRIILGDLKAGMKIKGIHS